MVIPVIKYALMMTTLSVDPMESHIQTSAISRSKIARELHVIRLKLQ